MTSVFTLNSALDTNALATSFGQQGFVSISDFIDRACAERLHSALAARNDWHWAINAGSQVYDIAPSVRSKMSAHQLAELDKKVQNAARDGFQFRFSSLRVPDHAAERIPDADLLHAFAEFMRSDAVLEFIRAITVRTSIIFADAQGTAYYAGDFLTAHDDDIDGKSRELAYVMGLTPEWRAEWGGLLLFHDPDGNVRGLVPRFNCLNIFAVPVLHSVSQVASFAGGVRYAVTGWLRSEVPA
ncbi:MAG: 2OG-Fe(II) oxygenase family protein [Sphingorhabdus sp.]